MVAAGTGVNSDALPFRGGKERSSTRLFKSMKEFEQSTRGIEFERQPPFGEVDLDARGAGIQTFPNIPFRLPQQDPQEKPRANTRAARSCG